MAAYPFSSGSDADRADAIAAQLSDPNSPLFKGADAYFTQLLREQKKRKESKETLKLPYRVTGEEARLLEKNFGVRLEVKPSIAGVTPFSEATVWLAERRCEKVKAWDGEQVVYVDGDAAAAVARAKTYWHICRSYATTRLLVNYSDENTMLQRMSNSKSGTMKANAATMLEGIHKGESAAVVCSDASRCRWRADVVMLSQHKASCAPVQVAALLANHGAVRARMWFFFETSMLDQDEGTLSSMHGRYYKERERDEMHIVPYGANKSLVVYKWSVLRAFAQCQTVVYDGKRYFSEIVDRTPGIIYIMLTDANGVCESETVLERRLDTGVHRKIDVSLRMFKPRAWASGSTAELVVVRVDKDVWESICARLMTMPLEKLSIDAARMSTSDYTQQRINIGTFIRRPLPTVYDVPEVVAQAAWRHVVIERAALELELTRARRRLTAQWNNTTNHTIAVLLRAMWDTSTTLGSALLDLPALLKRYATAATITAYDDYVVTIKDAATECVFTEKVGRQSWDCGNMAYAATTVGFPAADDDAFTNRSAASSEFSAVRERAAHVVDELRRFDYDTTDFSPRRVEGEVMVERDVVRDVPHDLGDERQVVVEKFSSLPDTFARTVKHVELTYPEPSIEEEPDDDAPEADVVGVLQEAASRILPMVTSISVEARPYVMQDAARSHDYEAPRVVTNGAKDTIAQPKRVYRSKLRTDVGGRRPVTQAATLDAMAKRIANAPSYSQPSDIEVRLQQDFEVFEKCCLQSGWKERVLGEVMSGLWDLDDLTIRSYAAKLSASNVHKVIAEDFAVHKIDLTKWSIMVKTTAKSRMEESTYYKEAAPQTIVYQDSKITNSWFSMKLGKFHDVLDSVLQPYVRINARRDKKNDEAWASSVLPRIRRLGARAFESDISQCDKSHVQYNIMLYLYVLKQFHAPKWMLDLWEVLIGRKTASATDVGVLVDILYQLLSGFWGTISMNSIVTSIANLVSFGVQPDDLVAMKSRGDDALLYLRTVRESPVKISENFRDMFNLEAKVFETNQPYDCSQYEVYFGERVYEIRDPIKVVMTLGRSLPASADKYEYWQSLRDSLTHYGNKALMDALDAAVQGRVGCPSIRDALRAIGQVKRSYESFLELLEDDVTFMS